MKRIMLLLAMLAAICGLHVSAADNTDEKDIIVAYVTSYHWRGLPDPTMMTHINYAFGHVAPTFDSVRIEKPERLAQIVALKKQNPELRVMLSIGGWGSGNFSEMAADTKLREAFAADCRAVVDRFGLDGIDIDWEYPSSDAAGISSSADDVANFTLLMRDLHKALGPGKLLTLASIASADFIDFKAIEPYVDFVNIMVYDLARPPYHHATLFRSDITQGVSCEEAVDLHIKNGMPASKLTLGMPFYGHGDVKSGLSDFIDYNLIDSVGSGMTRKLHPVARVPYLTDSEGRLIVAYDDAGSIAEKCRYARSRGLKGAMYWEYAIDDADGTLRKAVFNAMRPR